MKYLAIISLIFSGYGFWQWLSRPETDVPQAQLKSREIEVENVVEKVKIQMSAQVKKSTPGPAIKKIPSIETNKQTTPEMVEEVSYIQTNDDKLLFELSNSGVDLDDISSAMEMIETSEGLNSDEYYDELISLLPAKTREIIENLIESKMIDGLQLKDFFDKYINRGMNSPHQRVGRSPGDEGRYEEEYYLRDVEY